jgi:hypothetical protein
VFVFYAPVAAAVVIIIILCMVTAIMGTPTWRAVRPRLPSFRPSAPLAHEEHGGRPFMDDGGSKSCIKIASTHSLSLVGLSELMKEEGAIPALLSALAKVGASARTTLILLLKCYFMLADL